MNVYQTPYVEDNDGNGRFIWPACDKSRVGRNERVGDLFVFETDEQLPLTEYTGAWPPGARKNTYTGPAFYKALTVDERKLLVEKAAASSTAGAIFEQIKLLGLDFNDPDDVAIIDKMMAPGVAILTETRRDILVG